MELLSYPGDYYLFGTTREPGTGNIGKHEDFIPGPTSVKRDTATKRWKRIVKDNLGIEANLYSMKYLGANKKILARMDLDSLRELMGIRQSSDRKICKGYQGNQQKADY